MLVIFYYLLAYMVIFALLQVCLSILSIFNLAYTLNAIDIASLLLLLMVIWANMQKLMLAWQKARLPTAKEQVVLQAIIVDLQGKIPGNLPVKLWVVDTIELEVQAIIGNNILVSTALLGLPRYILQAQLIQAIAQLYYQYPAIIHMVNGLSYVNTWLLQSMIHLGEVIAGLHKWQMRLLLSPLLLLAKVAICLQGLQQMIMHRYAQFKFYQIDRLLVQAGFSKVMLQYLQQYSDINNTIPEHQGLVHKRISHISKILRH